MTVSNSTCRLLGHGRRGKFAARSGLSPPGPRRARPCWVQPAPRVLPAFFNQTRLMNIQRRSSRSPDAAQRLQRGYARLRRATGGVLLCGAAYWTMLRILAEALACSPLQDALFWLRSIEKGGPRDDDIFPALSPAWPGQRPANAFAGLTRAFYRTSPGLPFVAMQRCAF
jgi:hypothetical protein